MTAIDIFIMAYVFLIGLVIGSYLNVLIYRIPLKLPTSKGFSFCPKCSHQLGAFDLVPLFSYIFLGGRCRYCKDKISIRYPIIELLSAVLYIFDYLKFGFSINTIVYFIVFSRLVVLAMIDIDYQIIPDRFHIIIAACAVISIFVSKDVLFWERVIGFFAISVPVYIIALLTDGIGEGDVKLFAVCGFLLGWKLILLTMLLSSVTAAAFGLILMLTKKAKGKTEIPFGPFIAFSVIVCSLIGNDIINLYLSLIS